MAVDPIDALEELADELSLTAHERDRLAHYLCGFLATQVSEYTWEAALTAAHAHMRPSVRL